MGRGRLVVAVVLVLSFVTAPQRPPNGRATRLRSLRLVSAQGVHALVPPKWKFRPLSHQGSHFNGIQASRRLARRSPFDDRHAGLQAYWVDATEVRVPSDYYSLAARGPVMDMLVVPGACRPEQQRVLIGRGHRTETGYVATASGVCHGTTADTRWSAFVAAPGFGPVRRLGIPQSGLYFVRVAVADGPSADERLDRLLHGVSFGGTPLTQFLTAAGA